MKAAIFQAPETMEVQDIPAPECGDGDVVLKVEACAICGTDIRIYFHGHKNVKPPFVTGHEICGTVHKVGRDVDTCEVGQRVIVVTSIGCGKCSFCAEAKYNLCDNFKAIGYHVYGGFAEYVRIPARAIVQGNLMPIPDSLSSVHATIVEPLSCVINGQEYLDIDLGDTVLVIGAGPVGLMHCALAKLQGASTVILAETSEARLNIAKNHDIDHFINPATENLPEKVNEITGGMGPNVAIVACSAKAAQEQALSVIAKQGRISFFGGLPKDDPVINFDSNILHYKEISVFGAFASYPSQYKKALQLVASGAVDAGEFITDVYPLEKITEAIEKAKSAEGLKVVIAMN